MINILSYVGMNLQSEVCLWCLLGLVRTIFDATLFKVNANLKQVWQMTMPPELTMPVQRVLRTMVSGVMLVQCFTVYVYLASYIVLLYPVFLEERPTLVLPWLLLAAVRKLLCELTSLALGLGTCVLLGPARPPCIKFVVVKFTSIMPAFYMWMLVFSYYHALKVASAFKTFPAVLPPNNNDYGLELAVRRRRTKSLLGEEQLRKKLVAHYYGERTASNTNESFLRPAMEVSSRMVHSTNTSIEETPTADAMKPLTMSTTGWSDIGAYEDWFGSEVMIPRDTDRILEQIVLMLLRIGAYLKKEGIEYIIDSEILNSAVPAAWHQRDNIDCAAMNADDTDTPPLVGSNKGNTASYLREYPQIFMKKQSPDIQPTDRTIASLTVHNHVESEDGNTSKRNKRATPQASSEAISLDVEKDASKKIAFSDKTNQEDTTDNLTMSKPLKMKQALKIEESKKISTERKPDELSKDKIRMSNANKILYEDEKKVYADNKISNEDKIKASTSSNISSGDKAKPPTISKLSSEDKITVHTDSNISSADKIKVFTDSKISSKNGIKVSANNKKIDKDKIKVSTDYKISKDEDKGKGFTDSKVLNGGTIKLSSDSQMINNDESKVSTDGKISNQDENKDSVKTKTSNDDSNITSTDAVSRSDPNIEHMEQDSQETENKKTKQFPDI